MDAVLQNFRRSFGPTTPGRTVSTGRQILHSGGEYPDRLTNSDDNCQEQQTCHKEPPRTERKSEQGSKAPPITARKEKGTSPIHPLNISYDRLLPLIKDHPDFKWSPPMWANPDQRNRSLRCDYHKDHDHETNHCQGLKFLVERLIRTGHLRRFIRKPTRRTETALAVDRAIAATEHPSDRVLVDPGSAAELLQPPAFRKMRVPLSHLSSTGRVLSGFNGATTLTVGDIALSVKAGPVTHQVLFSVVEDLGPYNAIIGRTWLHTMKAVPSTYHQSISAGRFLRFMMTQRGIEANPVTPRSPGVR